MSNDTEMELAAGIKSDAATGVDLGALATDLAAERDGVWIEHPRGFEARIASTSQREYQIEVRKLAKLSGLNLNDAKTTIEDLKRALSPAYAKHLMRDVRGLNDNGKPIKYTPEVGERWFKDPRFKALRDWVLEQAGNIELFREDREKELLGN
jgi:hypothetical protein